MIRAAATLFAAPALASPALAQEHRHMPGMDMPGMTMPAAKPKPPARPAAKKKPAAKPKAAAPPRQQAAPAPAPPAADEASHADHGAMPGMDMSDPHAGHDMSAMPGMSAVPGGTDLPAGDAAPPPAPSDHYADRAFPPAEMAHARMEMMRESGGATAYQLMLNLAEYQARAGRDSYRWDGEAWFGADVDRLTLKSEGEGAFGDGIETAEAQALWSHAIGPYFNLQAGARQDIQPGPDRTYATIGVEGLAPYQFDVEGALFLSGKGDLLARAEATYDQRIIQRLILQPRAELNFSAQDVPETRIGSGLVDAELGLRLRYEIRREFAPYVGLSWERRYGDTARLARAAGEDTGGLSFVAGIRLWF